MENDSGGNDTGAAADAPARYAPGRTLLSMLGFLAFFLAIALGVGLFATSPWMRVSPDCSVVCVFANDIKNFF